MEPVSENPAFAIPPALLAEVEAAAELEHRPAVDLVKAALERYLAERQSAVETPVPKRTAAEAVERMLEQRKGNVLPEGVTIRRLLTYGRA
jgi:hypothetical protein